MNHEYLRGQLDARLRSNLSLEDLVNAAGGEFISEAAGAIRDFTESPSAESLLDLEQLLFQSMIQLSEALSALVVGLVLRTEGFVEQAVTSLRQAGVKAAPWRHEGLRSVLVRFLDGLVLSFTTPYLTRRLPEGGRKRRVRRPGRPEAGSYPALAVLGVRHGATPALQSAVARQVIRGASLQEAEEVLLEFGDRMNVKTVRRIASAVGGDALTQRQARIEVAAAGHIYTKELAGQRVVVGLDGGRVRIREGGDRGRRRPNGHRGFHARWREPKLVNAYVIDHEGRPVRSIPPVFEATMGGPGETFELLVAELKLRGVAEAKEVIVIADGASWIWNRASDLSTRLGISEDKVTRVADFFHVIEHLQTTADSRKDWSVQDVQRWIAIRKCFLRQGRIDRVIADVRSLKKSGNRRLINREAAYFQRLAPFMRYNLYRDRSIPLGSGATESAIRRVINLRIKGPGTFWKRESAERALHLRAWLKAGRWSELLRRVIHASPDGQPNFALAQFVELKAAA